MCRFSVSCDHRSPSFVINRPKMPTVWNRWPFYKVPPPCSVLFWFRCALLRTAVVAICGSFTPLQRCGAFTLFDRFKICDVGQKERLLLAPAVMGVVTMILNTSQLSCFCLNYIISRLLSLFFRTTSFSLDPEPDPVSLSSCLSCSPSLLAGWCCWERSCHAGMDGGTTGRFGAANCFLIEGMEVN